MPMTDYARPPRRRDKRHILFISYARKDEQFARGFRDMLQSEGHEIWWDRKLKAGQDFPEEIEEAIYRSAYVLCLWSANSIKSRWVRHEAKLAFALSRLLPVRIGACEIPEPY